RAPAELRAPLLASLRKYLSPGRAVRPADEDRRPMKVFRPPREDAAVHEFADILRPHAAVAENLRRPRIDRHHAIEDARLRVGVELQKYGRFVRHETRDTRHETRGTSSFFSYSCLVSRVSCLSSSVSLFLENGVFHRILLRQDFVELWFHVNGVLDGQLGR